MSRGFKFVIAVMLFLVALFAWQPQLITNQFKHRSTARIDNENCNLPITWRLNSVDPRFLLEHDTVLQALRNGANWWNSKSAVPVFAESPQGFAIDLVYDDRQQQLKVFSRVNNNVARYDDEIKQQSELVEGLQQEFSAQHQQYQSAAEQLSREIQQYNQQPTSEDDATQLNQRKNQLQQQWSTLEQQQNFVNQQIEFLQRLVTERNRLLEEAPAPVLHAKVGLLTQQGNNRHMEIFAFTDLSELTQTAAHEFGHALGLEHLPESDTVMHEQLSPGLDRLTDQDIAAMVAACPSTKVQH